jgi:hypothetical protein
MFWMKIQSFSNNFNKQQEPTIISNYFVWRRILIEILVFSVVIALFIKFKLFYASLLMFNVVNIIFKVESFIYTSSYNNIHYFMERVRVWNVLFISLFPSQNVIKFDDNSTQVSWVFLLFLSFMNVSMSIRK